MKKVSVIGAGNMGGAVAMGLARFRDNYDVTVTTAHAHTLEKYALEAVLQTMKGAADLALGHGTRKEAPP